MDNWREIVTQKTPRLMTISWALLASTFLATTSPSFANPSGGTVTGGSATISGEGSSHVIIDQTSDRAFIEWQDFSVGSNEQVSFQHGHAGAITANKVIGTNPSEILGRIQADGQIFIINGNGVIFGESSVIDAAGLLATTHNLDMADFMAGTDPLDLSGGTEAIINNGNIAIREGGFAALLAPHFINNGIISARLGKVTIGASEAVSVDFFGDGLLSFTSNAGVTSDTAPDGQALIEQLGTVSADGGIVTMTAKAASNLINQSINLEGVTQAQTVAMQEGRIILSADGGVTIEDTATLDASGGNGAITISASGISQGGTITAAGTDEAGSITLTAAKSLSLAGTTDASSTTGDGGSITFTANKIIETSDARTSAAGATAGGRITVTGELGIMSSGTYDASASAGAGGAVDITAGDVRLLGATINASGTSAGGIVRVGGAFQGGKTPDISAAYYNSFVGRWPAQPDIDNAARTFLNDAAQINISATAGAGGTAIIWSDDQTTFLGSINATGTSGGSVELSSAATLRHASLANVNVGDGYLLLDPKNITIGASTEVQSWSYQGVIGRWFSADTDVSDLDGSDRFGSSVALSSNGQLLAVGAPNDDGSSGSVTNAGAVYLFTFSDGDFSDGTLVGRIGSGYTGTKSTNVTLEANDEFGSAVALDDDGNRLAIGAWKDDGRNNARQDTGAAYLYSFTDTAFAGGAQESLIGYAYNTTGNYDVSDLSKFDYFGSSIALNDDGSRMVVGAKGDDGYGANIDFVGAVHMFTFTDTSFNGADLSGTIGADYTGNGNYDYTHLSNDDHFGLSVGLSSNAQRLIVGHPHDDGDGDGYSNSGAVTLFSFSDGDFSSPTPLIMIGNGYKNGNDIDYAVMSDDKFGKSVAITNDGQKFAVGAFGDDGFGFNNTNNYGAVHLFTFSNTNYTVGAGEDPTAGIIGSGYTGSGNLNISNLTTDDEFGSSVALNGTGSRLVIGARKADGEGNSVTDSGDVTLVSFSDTSFGSPTLTATMGDGYLRNDFADNTYLSDGNQDEFGSSLAFNTAGTLLAVGASSDQGVTSGTDARGAVHLYSFTDSNYSGATLQGVIGYGYTGGKSLNFDPGTDDKFGSGVALSGDGSLLAVGESNDGDKGAVQLFSFTDTAFSSPSHVGTIGEGHTDTNDINISLTNNNEDFGASVALSNDGSLLAIGAPGRYQANGGDTNEYGGVYLVRFTNTDFTSGSHVGTIGRNFTSGTSSLDIAALESGDEFGASVALDGDGNRLAIGAAGDDGDSNGNPNSGAVYLVSFGDDQFTNPALTARIGNSYSGGQNIDASLNNAADKNDKFGSSVALNDIGDRLAVGAPIDSGSGGTLSDSGAAYLFSFTDANFTNGSLQVTIGADYTSSGEIAVDSIEAGDQFGGAVALNGDGTMLAVGATRDDGRGNDYTNAGATYLFNASHSSGAYPSSSVNFASQSGKSITVNAYEIADLITRGTNVTLQASNDITVSNAITAGTFGTNKGDLTLAAGRSILVNQNIRTEGGDINLYANDTTANGVVDAQRDAGSARIGIANNVIVHAADGDIEFHLRDGTGKTNTASGNISIGTSATLIGAQITLRNDGPTSGSDIVISSGGAINASATGDAIILASDNFVNNSGSSAVNPTSGRYQIWSTSPSGDTLGGLSYDFVQYNATYGTSSVLGGASENGLFHTYQPTVTPTSFAPYNKTYDGTTTGSTNPSYALSGVESGESVTLTQSSVTYDTATASSGKTVTVSGISVASASRGSADVYGYAIGTTSLTNSNGAILQKGLTLTGYAPNDKTYDGSTTATVSYGSLTGLVDGDTVTLDTSSVSNSFDNANVGTGKTVTTTNLDLSGADAGNYRIANQTGTADITAKALSLGSINASNKTYNANTTASIASYGALTGVVGGDTVTLNSASASASFADANAGTGKTVTVSGLALGGSGASNYSIANQTTTADITPKALSIGAATASNKTYDGTTNVSLSAIGSLSGFVGSETVTATGSGSFADKTAANGKTVTISYTLADGTNGGLASNYSLADTTTTADITQKTLTLSGQTASDKTYDGSTSATVTYGTLSGIVGSDTVTLDTSSASNNFATASVGTNKTVNFSSLALSGADAGNYAIGTQQATADITAKALTLGSINASNKTYDANTTASIASYGGLTGVVGGDTVTLDSSSASASFADANAGTGKTVTVSSLSLSGAQASNYSIANQTTTADITAKALTISAPTASNKTYDGSNSASVTTGTISAGLVGSETVTVSSSASFADANVGTGKTVTVSYNLGDGTNGGLAANYTLADSSVQANITAKALTISAPTITDKTYDGSNSISVSAGNLSGYVGSETLNVSASGSVSNADAGTGKYVTVSYNLTDGTNGGVASNYSIADGAGSVTISPAPLTLSTLNVADKTYDGSNSGTATFSGLSGFIGSETVTALAQANFADANVGTNKTATVSFGLMNGTNGGKASNYSLSDMTRNASITAKALTISGSTVADKTYDATNAAQITAGTLNGLVGSEELNVTASGSFADATVGAAKNIAVSYSLADGTNGGLASNYTLAGETLTAAITKRILGLSGLSIADKLYNASNTASITSYGSLTNIAGSDAVTLDSSAAQATFATQNAGLQAVSVTGLSLSGADSANYDLSLPTISGRITPLTLSVSGSKATDKYFDGTRQADITIGTVTGFLGGQSLEIDANGLFSDAQPGPNKNVSISYQLKDGSNGGLAQNYQLLDETVIAAILGAAKDKLDAIAPIVEKQIEIQSADTKIEFAEKLEIIERVERNERLQVRDDAKDDAGLDTSVPSDDEIAVVEAKEPGTTTETADAFVDAIGDWTILSCQDTQSTKGICTAK